jgi:HEAT repeat protein
MCCEETATLKPAEIMSHNTLKTALAIATTTALTGSASAAASDDLLRQIKSTDDAVRGPAWQNAGPAGAPAVQPLAATMSDPNFEIARCAKRALYKVVRHAGRPGAAKEALAVQAELLPLLKSEVVAVRREVLWMLSEIGTPEAVAPMATLLTDKEVREDARCALMRIPGRQATQALKTALAGAPEEFKFALADSLRKRGETVKGYPSQKLKPTRTPQV